MPFTSLVVNVGLDLDAKKQLAAAVTKIFVDSLKVWWVAAATGWAGLFW